VVTSAPVDGRRVRSFSSESAASLFSSVIRIVVDALRMESSSPALLCMVLHFLQLLDKV
jgi:hypothetical protein